MAARKNIYVLVALSLAAISTVTKLFPLSKETKLSLGYSKRSFLNFTELSAIYQFDSEEHTVVTEDGYILTIFRMFARNCLHETKRRPVLLMHGLLQNSDSFLDAGTSAGLAYLLADDCFDVWVGNQRGNNYGRKHLHLNPDMDSKFWQFSMDEIAFYDLPATMDYILNRTAADKVNYVGFSQGSGIFFAMCSERPEYCKKIGVSIALGPAVFVVHYESLPLRLLFKGAVYFKGFLNWFGIQEVFSKGGFLQELLEYLCQITESRLTKNFCGSGALLDNFHSGSVTPDTQSLMYSHLLVGTSLNTLARYGQISASGKFQKYNYGEKMNLELYNSTAAPEYDLGAANAPVLIIQGRSDKMVDVQDTKTLVTKLPNVIEMVMVSDPQWTHFDMVYSREIKTMIYPKVHEYLQMYS